MYEFIATIILPALAGASAIAIPFSIGWYFDDAVKFVKRLIKPNKGQNND